MRTSNLILWLVLAALPLHAAVLNNGLMLNGVGQDKTAVIKGLVLLAAVAFDVYNKNQGKASIIGHLTKAFQRDNAPAEPDAALAGAAATTVASGDPGAAPAAGPVQPDTEPNAPLSRP